MDDNDQKPTEEQVKAYLESDEYKRSVEQQKARMEAEYNIKEEADWFGKTGLGEEIERELAHYLRREFGESLHDEGSLKAHELNYIGSFPRESGGQIHYWRIPWKGEEVYATVEVDAEGNTLMGWGNAKPPE